MYSKVYPAFSNLQPFLTEYKACFKDPKAASKKRDKWNRKWQAKRAAEQAELEAKKGVKKTIEQPAAIVQEVVAPVVVAPAAVQSAQPRNPRPAKPKYGTSLMVPSMWAESETSVKFH